jgi:adenosylcobinamide kinase / adenosylcobinamide-phosphate guanylyltransferase
MWADEMRPPAAMSGGSSVDEGRPDAATLIEAAIDELVAAWRQTSAVVVAVTDQVGSGLVPAYPAGRVFRDQLGWLNQRLAAESELNLQVTAGRVTTLPG